MPKDHCAKCDALSAEIVNLRAALEDALKHSVVENGRKGGKRSAELHGPEFYSAIGKKGGLSAKEKHLAADPDYYKKIGKMGGDTVRARGHDFFSEIGKKGAATMHDAQKQIREAKAKEKG